MGYYVRVHIKKLLVLCGVSVHQCFYLQKVSSCSIVIMEEEEVHDLFLQWDDIMGKNNLGYMNNALHIKPTSYHCMNSVSS